MLSEEELRLLEQMERALAAEDPKFVSTLQGRTLERAARLRAVLAGVVFLGGVAVLVCGAVLGTVWLGVVGFVIMVASATLGLSAWRGRHAPRDAARSSAREEHPASARPFQVIDGGRRERSRRPRSRSSFMQRVEMRWQRRREQGF
ncbi:MAG: DUF3040 domain-containing protein [Marmoricola sp.]